MMKIKHLMPVLLSAILLLTGCSKLIKERDAIISMNVNKVGIIHTTNEGMIQWIVTGDEINTLRDWAAELKCLPHEFAKGQSPDELENVEYYNFFLTDGEYRYISYAIVDENNSYIFLADNWYSVSNPTTPPLQEPASLTLDDVKKLAEKGEDLTWSDFEQYKGTPIGSGMYILLYSIDENYELRVGGTPEKKPMNIRLVSTQDDTNYIDIRTDSIDAFINK